MIRLRWSKANGLTVTIRPPLGDRAGRTARSISPGSRTLTGLNSTPNDGATDWSAPNRRPSGYRGIAKDCRRFTPGAISLSSSAIARSHVVEQDETSGITARLRQISTKPPPTRSMACANVGTVRVVFSAASRARGGQDQRPVKARPIPPRICDRGRHRLRQRMSICTFDPQSNPIFGSLAERAMRACPSDHPQRTHEHTNPIAHARVADATTDGTTSRAADKRDEIARLIRGSHSTHLN